MNENETQTKPKASKSGRILKYLGWSVLVLLSAIVWLSVVLSYFARDSHGAFGAIGRAIWGGYDAVVLRKDVDREVVDREEYNIQGAEKCPRCGTWCATALPPPYYGEPCPNCFPEEHRKWKEKIEKERWKALSL